jgi:hypothetical protein
MMPKLDIVNWTMRAAKQLRPEHNMDSDIEGPSAVSILGVLEGERGEPSSEGAANVPSVQLTEADPEPVEGRTPNAGRNAVCTVGPDVAPPEGDR